MAKFIHADYMEVSAVTTENIEELFLFLFLFLLFIFSFLSFFLSLICFFAFFFFLFLFLYLKVWRLFLKSFLCVGKISSVCKKQQKVFEALASFSLFVHTITSRTKMDAWSLQNKIFSIKKASNSTKTHKIG